MISALSALEPILKASGYQPACGVNVRNGKHEDNYSFDKNDNEISFKCKAIWVKKMEFGKYYIGFTITDIDRDAQLKLKNFVQYLLQGE